MEGSFPAAHLEMSIQGLLQGEPHLAPQGANEVYFFNVWKQNHVRMYVRDRKKEIEFIQFLILHFDPRMSSKFSGSVEKSLLMDVKETIPAFLHTQMHFLQICWFNLIIMY